MFFSKEVTINKIEHRISVLRARGEVMNDRLIKALIREKRRLEEREN